MDVTVTMACGCRLVWDGKGTPVCDEHQEHRVRRTSAPPPRIVAVGCAAQGPLVRHG